MHGNVWEWCHDYYDYLEDYYKQSPEKDPTGGEKSYSRILRGGAWMGTAHGTRSAFRGNWSADDRLNYNGFRVVRELD